MMPGALALEDIETQPATDGRARYVIPRPSRARLAQTTLDKTPFRQGASPSLGRNVRPGSGGHDHGNGQGSE